MRVYDNVTYIVAAIALRDGPDGREVLLMREAKEKCRGKWYMPAGHVEPGETIEVIGNWALAIGHWHWNGGTLHLQEAVRRELREETGLEGEPETLLCVEVRGSGWYRLAFFVQVTGGVLKQQPDQEWVNTTQKPIPSTFHWQIPWCGLATAGIAQAKTMPIATPVPRLPRDHRSSRAFCRLEKCHWKATGRQQRLGTHSLPGRAPARTFRRIRHCAPIAAERTRGMPRAPLHP